MKTYNQYILEKRSISSQETCKPQQAHKIKNWDKMTLNIILSKAYVIHTGGAAWGRECRRRSSVLPPNLSDTAATIQDDSALEFSALIAGRQCYLGCAP